MNSYFIIIILSGMIIVAIINHLIAVTIITANNFQRNPQYQEVDLFDQEKRSYHQPLISRITMIILILKQTINTNYPQPQSPINLTTLVILFLNH